MTTVDTALTGAPHPPARDLLLLAVDHGWDAALQRGTDTDGCPYQLVKAQRPAEPGYMQVSWHTHDTSTFRFWGALVGQGQRARWMPLKAVREVLTDG